MTPPAKPSPVRPARAGRSQIDISVPLSPSVTVFPGTPAVSMRTVKSLEAGDDATVSAVSLSTHSATHIDAPCHFLPGGAGAEETDLSSLNGNARVLDLRTEHRVGPEVLRDQEPQRGERLLLRTANSSHLDPPWYEREFDPDYAHLSAAGAEYLVDRGVSMIGIDYLSIGSEEDDNDTTHRSLLSGGVTILEGLSLESVEPGSYELLCLPLLMPGGDGAPARALLLPVDGR